MKIVIVIFALPSEINELERVLIDLNRASKHVANKEEYEINVYSTTSDKIVDWFSINSKEYITEKFFSLTKLTNWANSKNFYLSNDIILIIYRRVIYFTCIVVIY